MNELIKRMKNSKILTVLFSVLLACILWVYVVNAVDPDIGDTIRNIPIAVSGQTVLKERELIVTEMSREDLDVRLVGKRNALFNLNNENIKVGIDVSGISAVGTYDLLCNVTLPISATGGGVTLNNQDSYHVTVEVEKRSSKVIPVSGVLSGSVAKGYQGGKFSVTPSRIEIFGSESLLKTIKEARVDLTDDSLKQTFSELLPIELVTNANKIIPISEVECKVTSAHVVYPVSLLKELELTLELIAGGGAAPEDVEYQIQPENILVSGPEGVLGNMQSVSVGEINLAEVSGDTTLLFPIQMPEGLVNESGMEEAEVTVQFGDLVKKTFEVTNFELRNIPEGYVAGMVSTSIPVTVRGTTEAVAALRASQLCLEIDLSQTEPAEGEVEVLASVVMDEMEGVGVVGTAYSAWVALTK